MSIRNKKKGPLPILTERWQELALREGELGAAVIAYRRAYPTVTPREALQRVKEFQKKYT